MKAPFIAWGIPLPGANYCTVTGDNFNGARLATEYLLSIGKQKIAFLGGPKAEQEVAQRYLGFETALNAVGLKPDPTNPCVSKMTTLSHPEVTPKSPLNHPASPLSHP